MTITAGRLPDKRHNQKVQQSKIMESELVESFANGIIEPQPFVQIAVLHFDLRIVAAPVPDS